MFLRVEKTSLLAANYGKACEICEFVKTSSIPDSICSNCKFVHITCGRKSWNHLANREWTWKSPEELSPRPGSVWAISPLFHSEDCQVRNKRAFMLWSVYQSAPAVSSAEFHHMKRFSGSQLKTGRFKSKRNYISSSAYPVRAGWLNAILSPLKEQFYAEKGKWYKKLYMHKG